jgi:hypothetical protein
MLSEDICSESGSILTSIGESIVHTVKGIGEGMRHGTQVLGMTEAARENAHETGDSIKSVKDSLCQETSDIVNGYFICFFGLERTKTKVFE